MSKQLSLEDQLASIKAVRDFNIECVGHNDYKTNANVIVLKRDDNEDNYIHNIFVDVRIRLGPNSHNVAVIWEQEFGDTNFKDVDPELDGIYYTNYYKMEYSYKELTIYSNERKIIIRA